MSDASNQPDDGLLRDQVRALAAPVAAPAGAAVQITATLRRRRERRTRRMVLGAAACVVAATGGVLGAQALTHDRHPDDDTTAVDPADRSTGRSIGASDHAWTPIAPSPLSPRHRPFAVWTGKELVVAGGLTDVACPPTPSCLGKSGTPSKEAAAYDPSTDSWRTLPDAPEALVPDERLGTDVAVDSAWSGTEAVFVLREGTALVAFDPVTDTWRSDDVPEQANAQDDPKAVLTALQRPHVRRTSYGREAGQGSDWVIDLTTGERVSVPNDPFGDSFERSMAWDGERLWLLSKDLQHSSATPQPSRLAVLEQGGWRVVDATTPAVASGQQLLVDRSGLVIPAIRRTAPDGSVNGSFEEHRYLGKSDGWATAATPTTGTACPIPAAGPGHGWLAATESLIAEEGSVAIPPCEQFFQRADTAVWAGDTLLVWGGIGPRPSPPGSGLAWPVTATGLRWTPPDPDRHNPGRAEMVAPRQ